MTPYTAPTPPNPKLRWIIVFGLVIGISLLALAIHPYL